MIVLKDVLLQIINRPLHQLKLAIQLCILK